MSRIDFELETIEAELEFWRDYIHWWENKCGRPAEKRMLETLAIAEQRYQNLCEINIVEDVSDIDRQSGKRVLN